MWIPLLSHRSTVADLSMTEVFHTRGVRVPQHEHDRAYFALVVAGRYREQCGSHEHSYGASSLAFCPAAVPHRNEMGPQGARVFVLELSARWIACLRDLDQRAGTAPAEVRLTKAFSPLLRLHAEFCRARAGGGTVDRLVAESLTAELIAHAFGVRERAGRGRPSWLTRAVEYLDAHWADPVRFTHVATMAGVHPVHLARVFREVHRCSMAEYLSVIRVRQACALLGARELSLAQIALQTGFADQSHFTRAFNATIGCPPGAFRRLVFGRRPPWDERAIAGDEGYSSLSAC